VDNSNKCCPTERVSNVGITYIFINTWLWAWQPLELSAVQTIAVSVGSVQFSSFWLICYSTTHFRTESTLLQAHHLSPVTHFLPSKFGPLRGCKYLIWMNATTLLISLTVQDVCFINTG
jgi:hypothetical protein